MPNAVYLRRGTSKVFKASGGDVTFSVDGISNGAGRVSARADFGAAPAPDMFEVTMEIDATSTPTTATVARVYVIGADASTGGTRVDGGWSESDQAASDEDRFRNCKLIASVQADEVSGNKFTRTERFSDSRRYFQVAVWNAYGVALSSTANDTVITITPLYYEIQ
jgi:hypothetical protein